MKVIWIMNRQVLNIIFMFLSISAFNQNNQELYDHRLDENKWEDLRDGIRYEGDENGAGREWTYETREDYDRAVEERGGGDEDNAGGNGSGSGGNGQGGGAESLEHEQEQSSSSQGISGGSLALGWIGYVLIGVLILALIALIFYMYFNSENDGTKIQGDLDLDDVNPTEIPLTELQRLLQEAIAKGNYRGAVRIYFIFIVRDLSYKEWIQWQKEKTNFHYLREMSGKAEFDDFNRSVSYFEIIWYGKRDIDAQRFEAVKPYFTKLLDKLGVVN